MLGKTVAVIGEHSLFALLRDFVDQEKKEAQLSFYCSADDWLRENSLGHDIFIVSFGRPLLTVKCINKLKEHHPKSLVVVVGLTKWGKNQFLKAGVNDFCLAPFVDGCADDEDWVRFYKRILRL